MTVSDYIKFSQSFKIRNPEPFYLLGNESVPPETQNKKVSAPKVQHNDTPKRRLKKKMKTGDAEGAYRNYNVDRVFRIQGPSAIRRKTRSTEADELRRLENSRNPEHPHHNEENSPMEQEPLDLTFRPPGPNVSKLDAINEYDIYIILL
jgi:hypothetical protein